ncbi:hypothetical protein AXI76_gp195 [Pseudoalteromonas phage H101]|uniref:Uncharacterized protein n=1 Tax=Pseudoalteromonas phage H101 TaxID=1654919 RepID=A0A0H4IT74_9CAUD|nr:hypothetical protein AXI76_gp195 [Pseudoalteromonas phage H101]AKO61096.1 hypothetical protein [Pseudoalteromonas phage H101]
MKAPTALTKKDIALTIQSITPNLQPSKNILTANTIAS